MAGSRKLRDVAVFRAMADIRASSVSWPCRETMASVSQAMPVVGICACSNTYLMGQSLWIRSSLLFVGEREPWLHSGRGGATRSRSRWMHGSTACSSGSGGTESGSRSHWKLWTSGGAGRAMLRSGQVSIVGQSGKNSWRARQSNRMRRTEQRKVVVGVVVDAQETVMEARDNYK
jgi:hypothetical protein